ncbi:MAG: heat-shock protein Hsp20 [Chitinophagaceae bacterium]|nr:heat-shock protein Hsp20 [Chitinophagaceae bacterium]
MSLLLAKRKRNGSLLPRTLLNNENFFDPFLSDFYSDLFDIKSGSSWMPSVNIVEKSDRYKLELSAPGLNRDDFKIDVQDNILTISSEKESKKEENEQDFKRQEFSYSSFSRSFALPDNCVADRIEANYENGILYVSLPKKENSTPKKEIKVK